jgi:hypothetical protein
MSTLTFARGSLGSPEDGVITHEELWGPDAFGIEAFDEDEQHSHKFPNVEFGSYPMLGTE